MVLLIGCSTKGSPQARQTPSVSASASLAATLSCRLPVISPTSADDPPGGWITFPGGDFARDPASLSGRLISHVPSYDRASRRWLPVESPYVAPDGASYILHNDQSVGNDFYLVDAKTGTRKFRLSGNGPPQAPGSWTIVKYASEGVYLWSAGMLTIPGLWLLDPQTGSVRLIDGSHYWSMVDGGAAWALAQPGGAEASTYNAVYRLDLASGQVSTWYEGKGNIRLLSPTSDAALLIATQGAGYGPPGILRGPNQLSPLEISPDNPNVAAAYLTHPGVWLALQGGGLALYERGVSARILTRGPLIFNVAGGCW